jgi:hypothetical protein
MVLKLIEVLRPVKDAIKEINQNFEFTSKIFTAHLKCHFRIPVKIL